MREHEIRRAVLDDLASLHLDDTLIVEEMGLDQGAIRVDIAVVNGVLAGFEIKSDWDNLARLPAQRDTYNAVFDEVTVVTGTRHLEQLKPLIPEWWGIVVAERKPSEPSLTVRRPAERNPARDPEFLAKLLWRDEALSILEVLGLDGMASAPRRVLWAKLASCLTVDELGAAVRSSLKARSGWSTVRRRSSGGG